MEDKYVSSLTARAGGGSFELAPAGIHPARCFQIIDLGVQETQFLDDDGMPKTIMQVRFVWELLDVMRQDGKPFTVSRDFTNSLNEKSKLLPFLESWRGQKFTEQELQGFELPKVIGTYCQVQIMHKQTKKGSTFPEVANAFPLDKSQRKDPINPNIVFMLAEFDVETFLQLPKFTQEKIKQSLTFKYNIEPKLTSDQAFKLNTLGGEKAQTSPKKEDIVIDDIGDEPINLDDIPF